MLIDYHVHSHFSPDSHADAAQILHRLQLLGIKDVCFTNHNEWFTDKNPMGQFDIDEAIVRFKLAREEIESLKPQFPDMKIKFGTELTYEADRKKDLNAFIKQMDFDFVLASVHHVKGAVISSHKNIEKYFENKTEAEAYIPYFEQLYDMAQWGNFDAIGHFDVIKKYGHEFYGQFNPQKYEKLIRKILSLLAMQSLGLELNSGCLHNKCHELFPHPQILDWAIKAGVKRFTLGSDAHEENEAGKFLDEALEIAKKTGIKSFSAFS